MQFNLLSLITFSGVFFSSFVVLAVFLKSKDKKCSIYFLFFIFFTNLSILGIDLFSFNNYFDFNPRILAISTISTYLIGPFFLFYIDKLLFHKKFSKQFLNFIPIALYLILDSIYLLKTVPEKIYFLNQFMDSSLTFKIKELIFNNIHAIGSMICLVIYFLLSLLKILKYKKLESDTYSDHTNRLSTWILYTGFINFIIGALILTANIINLIVYNNFNIMLRITPVFVSLFNSVLCMRILLKTDLFFSIDSEIESKAKNKNNILDTENIRIIMNGIAEKQIYKDSDLTLPKLAEIFGITRTMLSETINTHFKVNFYDFINKLRIDYIKNQIEEEPENINLLDLAYEAGFKTKSTFNLCFKRYENQTPTQYRQKILN